jgi:hypothetical protein
VMLEKYERELGPASQSIGAPPPKKRGKKPRLPLFASDHPEFGDEIERTFGSDEAAG